MDRREVASQLRAMNYNCAQSVFCSMEDLTEVDRDLGLTITESLGGGFRCGEICGALSGAIIGATFTCKAKGKFGLRDETVKKIVNEITAEFKEREGHIACRDLLASSEVKLCGRYIADGAEIAEKVLKENGII